MSLLDTLRFAVRTARLAKASTWSPEKCNRVARRRLVRLVRYASARSPHFRQKYSQIDLDRFQLGDLPISTKEELRTHFDQAVTDERVCRNHVEQFIADPYNIGRWFLDKYAVSHTSGSQGAALPIVQDRAALELLFSIMSARANANRKPGIVEGYRRLREPARVAVVAQHRGFYPSAAAFEFMAYFTRPFSRVAWFSATDPQLTHRLNEFQPHTLVGYASVLEGLSFQSAELRLEHLQQIANSSEQLTPRARTRISNAFRVPILDHYGIGECLFLSDGCPTDGGAHINADWAIVEVVDDDYRPAPPGELGKRVLVTNLANYVQPFIRYEVTDQVVLASRGCQCGSNLPRIERIEGRTGEAFWYCDADGAHRILPGVLFHNAIDAVGGVREWRAVQIERNRVELQLELLAEQPSLSEFTLLQKLREAGLPKEVSAVVEIVVGLQPDRQTGKYRRMISHVGPPEHVQQRPSYAPAVAQ